jgi:fructokinase
MLTQTKGIRMILCCGEALIDMIPTPLAAGGNGFAPHVGGAVFNTACGLGRLDVASGMLTGLSRDMFGAQLVRALNESNVATKYTVASDRPSTLAFVELVDGHAKYAFFDENSAGRMLQTQDLPRLEQDVTALFFGGISLACEPGADTYATFLAQNAADHVVMIDPNIRAGFIADEARYRARLTQMFGLADLVKVSDEDLAWLEPQGDITAQAQALQAKGPGIVIVTRGKDGALAVLPNGAQVPVPAQQVQVVDTVGAGDSFNAGVLAYLSKQGALTKGALAKLDGDTMASALAFAAKVAAVTVSRAGANPPWLHELN